MIAACEACLRRSHALADVAFSRRWPGLDVDAACRHSESYPPALRDLHDPPHVLYATDRSYLLERPEPAAAVIGSRRSSEYGRTVAHRLGRGLGAAGVPVVSGLALGIDAIAHSGCLDGCGRTIAVLACGVDVPYPRTNRALYERIRREGTIVSELPPGARPARHLFPARNRIMAALSHVTVVVEAAERSGTLITADFAADIGRQIAAVPGRVTSAAAAGTNALIRDGAALVTGPQDVLDLLYGVGARAVPAAPERPLDERARAVLEALSRGEGVGEMAAALGVGAGVVRAALARLERSGLVRRTASGTYVPAA